VYGSVAQIRAEGVSVEQADDARVVEALATATSIIDRATGWFFEPRTLSFALDGRGTRSLLLPVPPIRIDSVTRFGVPLEPDDVEFEGAPVTAAFDEPRIMMVSGRFPRGEANVRIVGLFGYTEPDGTDFGRTPRPIERAAVLLALRLLPQLATDAGADARDRWRIIEEKTRDQSVKFLPFAEGAFTGDAEVDRLIRPYRRPSPLGAA